MFETPSKLKRHQKTHEGYKCSQEGCDLVLPTWSTFRKHIAQDHKAVYECAQCDKTFTHRGQLRIHVERHEEVREVLCCPACPRTYASAWGLSQHFSVSHQAQRFTCSACPKTFATKQKLQQHEGAHDPDYAKPEKHRPVPTPKKRKRCRRRRMSEREETVEEKAARLCLDDEETRLLKEDIITFPCSSTTLKDSVLTSSISGPSLGSIEEKRSVSADNLRTPPLPSEPPLLRNSGHFSGSIAETTEVSTDSFRSASLSSEPSLLDCSLSAASFIFTHQNSSSSSSAKDGVIKVNCESDQKSVRGPVPSSGLCDRLESSKSVTETAILHVPNRHQESCAKADDLESVEHERGDFGINNWSMGGVPRNPIDFQCSCSPVIASSNTHGRECVDCVVLRGKEGQSSKRIAVSDGRELDEDFTVVELITGFPIPGSDYQLSGLPEHHVSAKAPVTSCEQVKSVSEKESKGLNASKRGANFMPTLQKLATGNLFI